LCDCNNGEVIENKKTTERRKANGYSARLLWAYVHAQVHIEKAFSWLMQERRKVSSES
jgi:hypothetical protein